MGLKCGLHPHPRPHFPFVNTAGIIYIPRPARAAPFLPTFLKHVGIAAAGAKMYQGGRFENGFTIA
jgi:hypothetical protein